MLGAIVIITLLSLSIGSFLNVCIYRIPRNISVVTLDSFCPHCNRNLYWFELIPVVGFFLNGGKCRRCQENISVSYPLTEIFVAVLGVTMFIQCELSSTFVWNISFGLIMLTIATIDWMHFIIPDKIILAGLVIGFVLTLLSMPANLLFRILSGLMCLLIVLLILVFGNWFFKKETMGMGDVKLAGLIGFYLGMEDFLVAFWIGSLVALLYGLVMKFHKKTLSNPRLPFGSFLAGSSTIVLVFSATIDKWIEAWSISLQ